VSYRKEIFPSYGSDFAGLFNDHGMEVRGKPFDLDFRRYQIIEFEKRLVWIVARDKLNHPIGYACSFWYRDLHFNERVAADDLWFVHKDYRNKGVGIAVKTMCHEELKKQGVVRIYDTIRAVGFRHATLMHDLGFEPSAIRWTKELLDIGKSNKSYRLSVPPENDRLGAGAEG
jgi:GNAT superfamily N-acetyltransferase